MTELELIDIGVKAVEIYAARHPRPPHVNITQAAAMLGKSYPTTKRILARAHVKINACGSIPIEQIDKLLCTLTDG